MSSNNVIRITCADSKGLIAAITGVLNRNGNNIVVMREFVEERTNKFFTRLEIEGEFNDSLQQQLLDVLPDRAEVVLVPKRKKDIVVLVTKEQHCLSDLLVRFHFGELHGNLKAVIGNHDTLRSFSEKFDLPFHHIDHIGRSHDEFEKELLATLSQYDPDIVVLAKFMRILSPQFVSAFENRIVNIHHSFLPAFKGANPYRQAFEKGVKVIGATAHLVSNLLDEGPIIAQQTIPVTHNNNLESMIKAGHEVEKAVLAGALNLLLEDRVFVSGNKTIVFE